MVSLPFSLLVSRKRLPPQFHPLRFLVYQALRRILPLLSLRSKFSLFVHGNLLFGGGGHRYSVKYAFSPMVVVLRDNSSRTRQTRLASSRRSLKVGPVNI